MNDKINNLIVSVYNKVTEDWITYKQTVLQQDKEIILKNSYNNAVAGEWAYFFNGADSFSFYTSEFKNDDDAEKALGMLLNLPNIIESLTDYVLGFDYIEFSQEGFGIKFEEFIEGYSGVKL